jgi:hypothetical protein
MCCRRALGSAVLLAALFMVPGCTPPFHFEKTFQFDFGTTQMYDIDAPRGEQKIRVEVTSAEPVNIDVAATTQKKTAEGFIDRGRKNPEKGDAPTFLASKEGVTTGSVDATIPAGTAYTVFISGTKKKTEVKLTVKSI